MPNPLASADTFQLPVFSEHNTPNWTEEGKTCTKAPISTLHGFKIMSMSFPLVIRADTAKWELSLKVLRLGELSFPTMLTHTNTEHSPLRGSLELSYESLLMKVPLGWSGTG